MSPRADIGTSQPGRIRAALDPAFVEIDGRSEQDLLQFTAAFSRLIRFFDLADRPDGHWDRFFGGEIDRDGAHTPDQALFRAFLAMLGRAQLQLNRVTERHLDYYYETVLAQQPAPAQPDRAFVSFALARTAAGCVLPRGTRLAAGKDASGAPLFFELADAMPVTRAAIAQLWTIQVAGAETRGVRQPSSGLSFPPFQVPPADATEPVPGQAATSASQLGFAIASPMFELEDGTRTLTVRIPCDGCAAPPSFTVSLSGKQGWIERSFPAGQTGGELTFTIVLLATDPAIVAYDAKVLDPDLAASGRALVTPYPVLKVVFGVVSEATRTIVSSLHPARATIDVSVEGATLYGSSGEPLGARPFQPFGPAPAPGAAFLFGKPEAFRKPLTNVTFSLQWLGLPDSFVTYYAGYAMPGSVTFTNSGFKAALSYLGRNVWTPLPAATRATPTGPVQQQPPAAGDTTVCLFTASPPPAPAAAEVLQQKLDIVSTQSFSLAPQSAGPPLPSPPTYEPDTPSGFWRLQLSEPSVGFGSGLFANSVNQATLKNAAVLMNPSKPAPATRTNRIAAAVRRVVRISSPAAPAPSATGTPATPAFQPLPSAPYVPTLESIRLGYSATSAPPAIPVAGQILPLGPPQPTKAYLLSPEGFAPLTGAAIPVAPATPAVPMLAQPDSQPPDLDAAYFLRLGIANVAPGETVAMLFCFEPAAALPKGASPPVSWHYLSAHGWRPLPAHALDDGTCGFQDSGIVRLHVPAHAALDRRASVDGIVWVQARCAAPVASPRLTGLYAQAAVATRVIDPLIDAAISPAAAGTITAMSPVDPRIAAVTQPLSSFGGRDRETLPQFRAAVSERLRHKQRASAAWDIERLVLERFPSIYYVRCLANTLYQDDVVPAFTPDQAGHVALVLLPRMDADDVAAMSAPGSTAYPPRVPAHLLADVEAYVQSISSPLLLVRACNAEYFSILTAGTVLLRRGALAAEAARQFDDDFRRFVSPWIYQPDATVSPPLVLSEAEVRVFVSTRAYVADARHMTISMTPVAAGSGDASAPVPLIAAPRRPWEVPAAGASTVTWRT